MKLDDRDIVCETDYSPLSNEELAAQIEWHAAAMSGVSAYDLERITGPARALLARVEAAEAEAARIEKARLYYQERTAAVTAALDVERANNKAAWQRVAELEAQLAWRPGSENPPAPDWYQVGDIGVGVYDLWYSGEAWHRSSFQGATYRTPPMSTPDYWRPIPPLPPAPAAPQETTP
jgi:hypothetical protein